MPGILPMKMISVGASNSQSVNRIAQACDRCRSKKIKCDGIRPSCSQCKNVGFECKTSDKLSRRAFPRGYTESLEERIRQAESKIKELEEELDRKEEKIEMLSKVYENRRPSTSPANRCPSLSSTSSSPPAELSPKGDMFKVQASSLVSGGDNSDSYFMGPSSGRAFVDTFKHRLQETGKPFVGFNMEAFLNPQNGSSSSPAALPSPNFAPPRLFSDQCVNIFFQEWAPLFPVIHKRPFLRLYDEYLDHPDQVTDHHKLAQLHLVFSIAGISTDRPDEERISLCENQWRAALDSISMENTVSTLQCLILAIIYCIQKGDYNRLQHYKGIAVGLSHRLGLHQSQKRFSFDALATEMRKRVFWTLYTVDCFSAALLGLPKLLKEGDIQAEFPTDIDDDNVSEKGFRAPEPGEPTKISSALALFRCSRILGRVLEEIYPTAATYELSSQLLATLEKELDEWSDNLPTHLKLKFVQDKPSTNMTGSRSALLSLAYYYVRSLIHRPAAGSAYLHKSSPSVIYLADSSKHIIQIAQLLEERNMTFSFCLNKNAVLSLCGLSLLYQSFDLKRESKLMEDSQRLVKIVIKFLEKSSAPGAADFRKLASSMINLDNQSLDSKTKSTLLHTASAMSAPKATKPTFSALSALTSSTISRRKTQPRPPLYAHTSVTMSENDIISQQEKFRRTTLPNIHNHTSQNQASSARSSWEGTRTNSAMAKRENRASLSQLPPPKPRFDTGSNALNLDYLSLNNTPISSQQSSPTISRTTHPGSSTHNTHLVYTKADNQSNDLMYFLGSLDNGPGNIYDATYGGTAPTLPQTNQTAISNSSYDDLQDLPKDFWDDMTSSNLTSNGYNPSAGSGPTQSVGSISCGSPSSFDNSSAGDFGTNGNTNEMGMDANNQFLPDTMAFGDPFSQEVIFGTF